jgi:hypothetical protein
MHPKHRGGGGGSDVVLGISPCKPGRRDSWHRRPQAIVDVITVSPSVPRSVRRRGVSQWSRFVNVDMTQVDHAGKLGRLVRRRGRGGRSWKSRRRRDKSDVVKVDSSEVRGRSKLDEDGGV